MKKYEEDQEDADIPELAVKALAAASRRAIQAGRPRVVVKHGQLIRIDASGTVVLKNLPARKKVSIRTKIRRHA